MRQLITTTDIYEVLCQLMPKQNDFFECNYGEEREELLHFGIETKAEFLDFMTKHRKEVLEIDASDIDEFHKKMYSEEYGEEMVKHKLENKYWFAYPGLLRIALELEFGKDYEEYARKRDE